MPIEYWWYQVRAIPLNPTDWKHADIWAVRPDQLGCDFSGEVFTAAGYLKVNDRVSGFVYGASQSKQGAFAEYVKTDASLVWKVSEGTSWEEAAALGGIGPDTAVHALYLQLELTLPWKPLSTPEPFLVYGGSTSVGLYAIQLAKLSGYTVIATASPKKL